VLGVLLRQRGRLLWNRLSRGPRRGFRVFGSVVTVALTVGFVVLAGLNAGLLVERVDRVDPAAASNALPVLLVGVTALTLVTSLSSAFHHLFLAGDLELLFVAPVPSRSLFGLKVLEIWRDSLHVILFQGAALYGFGQSLHLPPTYYLGAIAVGVLLTLSASAVGATLTMVLARVRFGELVLGFSRVLAVLFLLPIGTLGVPAFGFGRNRLSLILDQGGINAVAGGLRSVGDPPTWAPTTWAAHVLLGDDSGGLSLALLTITAVVLFAGMQLGFEWLHQGGWERVRFSIAARPMGRRNRLWRLVRSPQPKGPIGAVLLKDWRTVIRDPRWRTGTLFSLVALGLPAILLFSGDPFARSAHLIRFWVGMLPVPYLAYLFGSQQGASTLAYEGRNLALLRAAPVGMARIVLAKVCGGLVMVLAVTWLATLGLGMSHNGGPLEIVAALLAATWLALGATLSAVAGAALTADFESDNPQRRIGCLGTIVTSSLSIVFFVANTAVLVWWLARSVFTIPRLLLAVVPVLDWGLPVLALLSVAAVVTATRLGMRRLAAWEIS
jgi:ABC-2 type transport system permease protein